MRVLFVCTANRCRSPMAEVLLRAALGANADVEVGSAGLFADGSPAPEEALAAVAPYGALLGVDLVAELSAHRSRRVGASDVKGADLVLAMTRHQAREVVLLDSGSLARVYTVREALSLGHSATPWRPGQPPGEWVASLDPGRGRERLLGLDDRLDVPDPFGGPPEGYGQTAAELATSAQQLVVLLGARSSSGRP